MNFIEQNKDKTDKEISSIFRRSGHLFEHVCRGHVGDIYNYEKGKKQIMAYLNKYDVYEPFYQHVQFFNYEMNEFIYNLKHQKDKRILIFFDPPYLGSDNRTYKQFCKNGDHTMMYIDILKIFNNPRFNCIMILNKVLLIDYLFQLYKNEEYGVVYQSATVKGKRGTNHVIYSNIVNLGLSH
jgi:hypothetical protein